MLAVTRELKLALIVGFFLVLLVSFLIADHLSASRKVALDEKIAQQQPPNTNGSPNAMLREPAPRNQGQPVMTFTQGAGGGLQTIDDPTLAPKPANADSSVMAEMGSRVGQVLNGEAHLPPAANTGTLPLSDLTTLTMSQNQMPGIDTLGAKGASEPRTSVEQALRDSQAAKMLGGAASQPQASGTNAGGVKPFAPLTVARPQPQAEGVPVDALTPEQITAQPQPIARPEAKSESKDDDRWHTIAQGDTAMKIAKRYYGDSNAWRELQKYNGDRIGKNGELRVGVRVRIPAPEKLGLKAKSESKAEPKSQPKAPAKTTGTPSETRIASKPDGKSEPKNEPKASGKTYTVKKGDTLGEIAMNQLGTMKRADEIVKLNGLKSAASIREGMTLKMPVK
jgi:nucleoid-associated protein YgaU